MWIVMKVHQLNITHAEVDKMHVTHAHKELAARFVKVLMIALNLQKVFKSFICAEAVKRK